MMRLRRTADAFKNKKAILKTKYRGAPSDEVFDPARPLADARVVKKQPGKDFVILNITDPHFADYDIRTLMSFDAAATIKYLVKRIQPDLITITGDLVCSDSTVYSIDRLTGLIDSFGIPWAPVFGNHDAEGNCDHNYLADAMLKSSHCLLRKGDPRFGCGNYVVHIAEDTPDGGQRIVESLIMMDTHGSHLHEDQIEWYKTVVSAINAETNGQAQTVAMFHIPTAEYEYAYNELYDASARKWKDGCGGVGEKHEKVCCDRDRDGNPKNNGFLEAAKTVGTTQIICGHEHLNNYSVVYHGVRITYALKVGEASGYRPQFNGGMVITVGDRGIRSMYQRTVRRGPAHDVWRLELEQA